MDGAPSLWDYYVDTADAEQVPILESIRKHTFRDLDRVPAE